ncbi:hypothetical protein KP509_14G048100 [Ceratopteris richardii]|uniref:CCHC-type domain-containing protein n=1 Tax=Ceratopteris richardii TaxID=49495 RepID=A0A8T2TCP4_CERRI|nr:hypothetical protein KP509_14G048100 [Ceratopteris richardii]
MKLLFLWPRLRHNISRRVRDQGPMSFQIAIQIAQTNESTTGTETTTSAIPHQATEQTPIRMDIDIPNAQLAARRALPEWKANGCPKCYFCNNYGHVRKECRKLTAQQHHQNAQVHIATSLGDVQLADDASLGKLPENL